MNRPHSRRFAFSPSALNVAPAFGLLCLSTAVPSRRNQSAGELAHSKPFVTSQVSAKLKEPEFLQTATTRKFEDVVKSAEQAAVLVLVY